jgi:hypothetical protein
VYDDDQDDFADLAWERAELTRRWAQQRALAISLGETFLAAARCQVHHGFGTRKACGLLAKASERFSAAGLTRRSRAVWRYSRMLHRASWRGAR